MNDNRFIKKDDQAYFPDFDRFMEIVKSARTALDDHPPKIEAGQIWGITDKDYRFIVLTSPEKSMTRKDIRVVPVTREKGLASVEDVIIPDGTVYRASSVVMPFQVTNISTDRLDLFFGTVEQPIVDFLQETVRSGKLAQLPDGTYSGEADVFDPVIMKFNSDLKSELLEYAEEVFAMIEQLQPVKLKDPMIRIADLVLSKLHTLIKWAYDQPQVAYSFMAAPGTVNLQGLEEPNRIKVDDAEDMIISFVARSGSVSLEFLSKKFKETRSINEIKLESTSENNKISFATDQTLKFSNRKITVELPFGFVEGIKKLFELKLSFKIEDKVFDYLIKY